MTKSKTKSNIKNIFNSAKLLIIILMVIIVVLIIFGNHLMRSSKTYLFSGKGDYVTILNGVVSLNYDVNLLQGSDISYTNEKDVKVISYKIGYYVLKENTLTPVIIKQAADEKGVSLEEIINEESAFNVYEPYRIKRFFNKEIKEGLDKSLFFIIEAETNDGKEILEKIELNISKVSK